MVHTGGLARWKKEVGWMEGARRLPWLHPVNLGRPRILQAWQVADKSLAH